MSTTTTNYGLIKPDTTDPILIGQLNDNADAIDAALKENADAIENKPDAADIPTPSTAAPAMDGTAAAGTSTDYARADHVHPSDTSKQDALTTAQLAAVNSGINSEKVAQIEINKNNILSKIGIEDVYGAGREILSNGTMNDTTLGKFFCAGAPISETVEGAPWTDSGYYGWTERSISATDRYVQIAIRNDNNFNIAKRRYTGTWSAWAYISSV